MAVMSKKSQLQDRVWSSQARAESQADDISEDGERIIAALREEI